MIKTLRKQGNGQALPVDRTTMDAMGISLDTPLEVTITGNTMVVTPVHVGLPNKKVNRIGLLAILTSQSATRMPYSWLRQKVTRFGGMSPALLSPPKPMKP